MAPPDTNIEKQTRRHRPVLIGFAAVLAFAAVMFLANLFTAADRDSEGLVDDGPVMIEEPVAE